MSEVNNAGALQRVLGDYALQEPEKEKSNELGKDEFLRLLVAQLENQDPTDPQENGEFIAQLAQFSQLEETQKMTASMQDFADAFQSTQHLQATSLVGRPVHVESEYTVLDEQNAISVVTDMPYSVPSATLSVFNEAGELVDGFELGAQPEGRNEFIWSGYMDEDNRFPPGKYSFRVDVNSGEQSESLPTYLSANVNSVTIEPGGSLTLNLAGVGPTSMKDVIQIN